VSAPPRPTTASRNGPGGLGAPPGQIAPMSGGARPPPTALGALGGLGGPSGGFRPPTGMSAMGAIPDRPMTGAGGIAGRAPTGGPGRQVLDKSYYLSELRTKNKELTTQAGAYTRSR